MVPNLHAPKPNWRFWSAQLHWADVSESHLCFLFLKWAEAATGPLQKSPQLTELFLAGLSLPWDLIPAIAYLSIHWHVLWNITLFLYCTSFGHLSYILLCLLTEGYFLNWVMARTFKKWIKKPYGINETASLLFLLFSVPDSHVATETRALTKHSKTVRFITKSCEWIKHYNSPTYNSSCGRQQEKQKTKYHTSWMLGRKFAMFFTKDPQHNKQKQNPNQKTPSHLFVSLSSGCFLTG